MHQLDDLTWQTGAISGWENHYYCVSCSDFNRDPDAFEAEVCQLLGERRSAGPIQPRQGLRLGYVGVPPIISDLYAFLESRDARIVFNEVQRQFSLPLGGCDLVDTYLRYTYPYGVEARLEDIRTEVERRGIAGIIHYVQSFCHHQIEDSLLRRGVGVPVLTLEADRPGPLDGRTKTRIEAFIESLEGLV